MKSMSTSDAGVVLPPGGFAASAARAALMRYRREDDRGVEEKNVLRFIETLRLIARISPVPATVCDVATFGGLEPALVEMFGIRSIETTGSLDSPGGGTLVFREQGGPGELRFPHHRFDLEERFPLPDNAYDLVIFTEVLEHLSRDPMHTMSELNRITRPGGWLLLTTPNCISLQSVLKAVRGTHPYVWAPYSSSHDRDRHNREYTPGEVEMVLQASGFEVCALETHTVYSIPTSLPDRLFKAVAGTALRIFRGIASRTRGRWNGELIFSLGRKTGPVCDRHPGFLYY